MGAAFISDRDDKGHTPRRVSRCVDAVDGGIAQREVLAVLQPAVYGKVQPKRHLWFGAGQRLVNFGQVELATIALPQLICTAKVVKVTMGNEDRPQILSPATQIPDAVFDHLQVLVLGKHGVNENQAF